MGGINLYLYELLLKPQKYDFEEEIVSMELTHFQALIPLLVLLILSLIFIKCGILHLMLIAYAMILGFIAILGTWELLFFPIVLGSGIIGIFLFISAMVRGEWF